LIPEIALTQCLVWIEFSLYRFIAGDSARKASSNLMVAGVILQRTIEFELRMQTKLKTKLRSWSET
jgi:hypothetical protein